MAEPTDSKKVTFELKTQDGYYNRDDLPKKVDGEDVEWDLIEPKPGGKDATVTGRTKN
jgi:hypothetical protein